MKVAIVCDDLVQSGGQERLVMAVCEIWPGAPLYTAYASKNWINICQQKKIDLRASFMQKLPLIEKLYRYYSPFMLHPLAFESFDFSGYDVVVSISSRFAHGVLTKPGTIHVCYMNSPGRMFWEASSYFDSESYGVLKTFKKFARPILSVPLSYLRLWDRTAAQKVDYFMANSRNAQRKIAKYYKRDSLVVYPFADIKDEMSDKCGVGNYFMVITRLQAWKRVDTAVEACTELNVPLKVIGEGPDLERLRGMAGPSIEFFGYVSDVRKKELLRCATALINTQKEDFGIVPVEAMAFGKPVIAYGQGGVLETVIPGMTGEFYNEQTAGSLSEVLQKFDRVRYNSDVCSFTARKFTKNNFTGRVKEFVNEVYLKSISAL
ncbi:hypothetical protein A2976_02590 [candidate division WWE3 bacterium RIFCSPLOWO2_01_FULL_41_9]|uniref:Glycosyl transferase family 1 domain-containing protein n=1 Tax=candidate division WWE3 bacterium RIFCSPLOWO2_01_FULL_41_9 TaxID=1802626 RepID=A0A1F4VJ83_UNCKA|nr:MAG: hypothetical protein A2976_02590 [candidate division WWE3 bacterium RIFCSPLOWO2_01_FULL_41_9]